MRPLRAWVALAAAVLFATACTPDEAALSTPTLVSPVADSAPYLCKLVPEQAFRLVSGVTGSLREETGGDANR